MRSPWAMVVAALVMLGLPAAATASPRVAVIGDDTGGVTEAVRDALGRHVELVDVGDGDGDRLARDHQLAAIVTVEVGGTARKGKATVAVRQGADGKRLASYQVKGKRAKLAGLAAARAWKQLGKAIGKARAPAPPAAVVAARPGAAEAPAPAAEAAPPPAPARDQVGVAATAAGPARPAATWLVLSADGRPFLRTLRYNDDIEQRLRSYDLAAPAAGVTATWVPRPRGPARFFALRGELELALGVNGSRTSSAMEFPTSSSEWSAGVRADLPIAGWRVIVDAAYGEHRFAIDDDAMAGALVPDVTYRWLRGALTVSVPVRPRLAIDAGGGWRQLLGTGDLGSEAWFPRVEGAGIDAELGATWRATAAVSLFARADLRRYFFSMNPEVGDDLVVGGAVDQYLAISAGLAVTLR